MFLFSFGKKNKQTSQETETKEVATNIDRNQILENIISELNDNGIQFTVREQRINNCHKKEIILKSLPISIISDDTTSEIIAEKCGRVFNIHSAEQAINLIL